MSVPYARISLARDVYGDHILYKQAALRALIHQHLQLGVLMYRGYSITGELHVML